MKKLFALLAFAATLSANAQTWQIPEYTGAFQPLTPGDTVYIYNQEAKMFLTEGNDYSTHASVGSEGLLFTVQQYMDGDTLAIEDTYAIRNYSITKGGWKNLFINAYGGLYVDYNNTGDYAFKFIDKGDNVYNIVAADVNTTYTHSGDFVDYYVGRYTNFQNPQTGEITGTGVLYDYCGANSGYQEGEFQIKWQFVSQADYATYKSRIVAYQTSLSLFSLIEEAASYGVDTSEAQAVYDNTSSTTEELEAAMVALNAKIMEYYQDVVTPENPIDLTDQITNATCNATDGWTEEMSASYEKFTFGTGSWISGSWEAGAFEGNYLNIWGDPMKGKVHQVVTGLPNGIYQVGLSVFYNTSSVDFFANESTQTIPVNSSANKLTILTCVSDGTLDFGINQKEESVNWIVVDNATLTYYGSGVEAYRNWLNMLLEDAPSFDDAVVQDSLVNVYNNVLASVNTAQTKEEILNVIPNYEDALNKVNASIKVYSNLNTSIEDAYNVTGSANTYYSEIISDYIINTAQDAYENHTLGTDEINAIVEQLNSYQAIVADFETNKAKLQDAIDKLQTQYDELHTTCTIEAAAQAEALLKELDAFDFDNSSVEQVTAMFEPINQAMFALSIPAEPASDDNPVDYTAKISYPSFDEGATGWTNDGWATCGYNSWGTPADGEYIDTQYLNLWNPTGGCRVYQLISELPNGTYKASFYAFTNSEGFQVYAGDNSATVDVSNSADEEGKWGHLYEVYAEVTDGTLELGARSVSDGAVWGIIDNVSLIYYGTESSVSISEAITDVSATADYYAVSGTRIQAPQHGITVVRYADGSVKKVFNK